VRLHTRICDLFGVEHPILNAPMGGGDAPGALAAAVSNGGGLGMIGGTTAGGVEWLRREITAAREGTSRPFGVGVITHLPGAAELTRAALDEGARIVAHSFGDPTPHVEPAHAAGALVICQVRSVGEARRAAAAGVDVITAQGTEAGGHTGTTATLALVPAVVDAVSPLPVLAAGGIGDGRGIAAALLLGAEGVWLGTAFLATPEAGIVPGYKARVLRAGTDDTVLTEVFDLAAGIPWPEGVAGRSIRNRFTDRWHGDESALQAWAADHREELRALSAGAAADPDTMPLYAGPAAEFVTRAESATEVVRRLAAEAAAVLATRPAGVLRADPAAEDLGGDPACWAHLVDEDGRLD
jgi:nitronate monooxygenase